MQSSIVVVSSRSSNSGKSKMVRSLAAFMALSVAWYQQETRVSAIKLSDPGAGSSTGGAQGNH